MIAKKEAQEKDRTKPVCDRSLISSSVSSAPTPADQLVRQYGRNSRTTPSTKSSSFHLDRSIGLVRG
jgi:hypothetical protein